MGDERMWGKDGKAPGVEGVRACGFGGLRERGRAPSVERSRLCGDAPVSLPVEGEGGYATT